MSAALERQIRPIYDAIDTGSNKSAIVACNKLLKKHPKNDLVKALKTLALVRLQKVEEALALCDEVLASKPTSDPVLSAMMHVLRGLGRNSDMVVMFEEAFKKDPSNEDLAAQTFFANVRASRWNFAQQVAGKMYKHFQEDRYLYWNVMSAVQQANDVATPKTMRPILYKLAHRLLTSSPTPSYQSADRFYLHLLVLKELSLWDEVDKLLKEDIAKAICATNLYCNEIRRDIYKTRGMLKEEGEAAKKLIAEKQDRNWLEFLSVLDGTFSYVTQTISPDVEARTACAAHIARTQKLLQDVATNDSKKDRSGPLGLLDLEFRARAHGLCTDDSRLLTLLQEYFRTFGDKACCFEDLKPYLDLPDDLLSQWTSFLNDTTPSFDTANELQRLINTHKLLRHNLSRAELTEEAEAARATLYISQYLKGLELGKSLPETELQPADDLAILAANVFVNIWDISPNDSKWLWNAVAILELGISRSPQSWLMRLMLVRIYRLLGAPQPALEHYRALRIKQTQNDTLSQFIFSRCGPFSLAATGDITLITEISEASQIYVSNTQETGEFVIRAFTAEKYTQIPEFITFEDRLENSLQRDAMKVEQLRMRFAHEQLSGELIDTELIDLKYIFGRVHHDNRDLSVLVSYQPKACQKTFAQQTELFGKLEGIGYLQIFLKLYIRLLQQASNVDDVVEEKLLIGDRPKQFIPESEKGIPLRERLARRKEEELADLTPNELHFLRFADALADWLEPFHDQARPPPAQVLAELAKASEQRTGQPFKGVDLSSLQNGNGHTNGSKKDDEPPAVTPPPEVVTQFFDQMLDKFKKGSEISLPEALHIAFLVQEALIVLALETQRFKDASVVKIYKLGNLVASFKPIRSGATAATKAIAAQLSEMSTKRDTAEARKVFVSSCPAVTEHNHDFILNVAKKLGEAQKNLLAGLAKGMSKIAQTHGSS